MDSEETEEPTEVPEDLEDSEEPNQETVQRLLEERCAQLEYQVSAIKNVSSLRKSLLELREKEVKDLLTRLKMIEEIYSREKKHREELSSRMEKAERENIELSEKLRANVMKLEHMKLAFENKIDSLQTELDNATVNLQERTSELTRVEGCNVKNMERVVELDNLLSDSEKVVNQMDCKLKMVEEKNSKLTAQLQLVDEFLALGEFEEDKVREFAQKFKDATMSKACCSTFQKTSNENCINGEPLLEKLSEPVHHTCDIPSEISCYKTVDTSRGPIHVLSASTTFLKLKDLILEKKALQKELDSFKLLKTNVLSKIDALEDRMFHVTVDLNKTWTLVSKLKSQHKKLYNSGAVLKYELHEKRKLLEKLKIDLYQSREKWLKVRQKNSNSQTQWETLRDEFSKRKQDSIASSSVADSAFSEIVSSPCTSQSGPSEKESVNASEEEETKEKEVFATDDYDLPVEELEDPLEELVSDLVEEIQATVAQQEDGDDEDSTEEPVTNIPDIDDEGLDDEPGPSDATVEERILRRAQRLQVLEEQCHLLHSQLISSTARSVALASRLTQLHDHYGSSNEDSHPQSPANVQDSSSPPTEESSDTAYGSAPAPNIESNRLETSEESEESSQESPSSSDQLESSETSVEATEDSTSFALPGDPHYLGRMIIQQLPKRLELLKQENESLLTEASEATLKAKEAERKLKQEQCKSNQITLELESEVKRKNLRELELTEELLEKDGELEKLKCEVDKLQERLEESERKQKDNEKLVNLATKSLNQCSSETFKKAKCCEECKKSFNILKRWKRKCKGCGKPVCAKCINQSQCENSPQTQGRSTVRAKRQCNGCYLMELELNSLLTKLI